MNTSRNKKTVVRERDLGSRASLVAFKEAAENLTKQASFSKKKAISLLVREGIVTPVGNLKKRYSAK